MANIDSGWVPAVDLDSAVQMSRRAFPHPNTWHRDTIIGAVCCIACSAVLWAVPWIRELAAAPKMLVIACHEIWHVLTGLTLGGQLTMLCIDPNMGGFTNFMGPILNQEQSEYSGYVPTEGVMSADGPGMSSMLLMGYFGSAVIGFFLVVCSFSVSASKVVAIFIAIGLLLCMLRAWRKTPFFSCAFWVALLIGLYFAAHGSALRFYVCLFGTMNLFYAVWDFSERRLFPREHPSCAEHLAMSMGLTPGVWATIWIIIETGLFIASLFVGMRLFPQSADEQMRQAQRFMPTK